MIKTELNPKQLQIMARILVFARDIIREYLDTTDDKELAEILRKIAFLLENPEK